MSVGESEVSGFKLEEVSRRLNYEEIEWTFKGTRPSKYNEVEWTYLKGFGGLRG